MRKLFIFTVGLCAAILLNIYLPETRGVVCVLGLCLLFLILGIFSEKKHVAVPALCGVAVGFLLLCTCNLTAARPCEALDGEVREFTAVCLTDAKENDYGASILVRLRTDGLPRTKAQLYCDGTDYAAGDEIIFTAEISRADKIKYDETNYYYAQGVFLRLFAENELGKTGRKSYSPLVLGNICARYVNRWTARVFDEDTAPLAIALLTGDKTELNKDTLLKYAFSVTGMSHIVAVSGMHLSFILSIPAFFVKNKRRYCAVGIPVILVFMAFAGFSPSVCRAGIMNILILAAGLTRREPDMLTCLSVSALLMAACNPYALASVAFQLSAAAMLGLITVGTPLNNRLCENKKSKVLRFIISLFASSVGALAFTVPLSMAYFGHISLVSPVVGMLILSFLSFAYLLLPPALLLGAISLPVGQIFAKIPGALLKLIVLIIRLFAKLDKAVIYSSLPLGISAIILLYTVCFLLYKIRQKTPVCLSFLSFCVLALCFAAAVPYVENEPSGTLTLTAFDVGQGQCLYFENKDGSCMIDCGGDYGAGETVVQKLRTGGTDTLGYLMLTHAHKDHTDGLTDLICGVGIDTLVIPEFCRDELSEITALYLQRNRNGTVIELNENMLFSLGNAEICAFAPVEEYDGESENEACLSYILSEDGFDYLVTGDMPASGEAKLVRAYDLSGIEVFVCGHHGAQSSTSDTLLNAAEPAACVISVGENSYGHPHEATLERLDTRGIAYYRTDELGDITVKQGG